VRRAGEGERLVMAKRFPKALESLGRSATVIVCGVRDGGGRADVDEVLGSRRRWAGWKVSGLHHACVSGVGGA
jgi:hypothetical protein